MTEHRSFGARHQLPVFAIGVKGTSNRNGITVQDPLGRYKAVMALPGIFSVEPVSQSELSPRVAPR